MARTAGHYGRSGERGAGISLQRVTLSEWEERNGKGRHKAAGCEDSANMAATGGRKKRSVSPEIPVLTPSIAPHTEKARLQGGEQLPGNDNGNGHNVSSKSYRKKRKLRKGGLHHVVMEQIKNIVKENGELRLRLLQLSQKNKEARSR